MNYINLIDVCNINMGQSPDSKSYNDNCDGIPFFQGNADFGERYPVTRVWCNAPTKIANPNDILISVRAPIGALNFARERCCIGRGLAAITPDTSKVSVEFIYWLLKGKTVELNSKGTGSTFKAISRKVLEETKVPDISLDQQLQYAAILEKIYAIINDRKQQLAKLDELVKARFVEMFGDVLKNDKKWIECPLGEICEKIVRYPTFYGMDYIESGTRVIRIGNILNDGHMETDDENYVFVYEGVNDDFPETVVEKNDIIMAVRGDGSAAKRIGFITENCLVGANISPSLIRIKANSSYVIPIFLFYYLTGEIGQKRLDAYVNKTAKKNIAAKDIVKVISPVPPLALQEQFAAFVAQTDKSKFLNENVIHLLRRVKLYDQF